MFRIYTCHYIRRICHVYYRYKKIRREYNNFNAQTVIQVQEPSMFYKSPFLKGVLFYYIDT